MAQLRLKNVRLSHFHGFEARDYKGNEKFKFSTNCLVEKGSANHKAIEAALLETVEEKFPGKGAAKLKSFKANKTTTCYRENLDEENEELQNFMVLATSRKQINGRPKIVDRRGAPLSAEDGKPYSGCFANVHVDIWAQTGETPGVRCELLAIQFVKDGAAFGGGVRVEAIEFDDLGVDENGASDMA